MIYFILEQCPLSGEYSSSNDVFKDLTSNKWLVKIILLFLFYYYFFSVGNSIITSCKGPRKYGTNIHIDFFAISHPCTCTVLPSFAGQLLIASGKVTYDCKTQIIVKNIQTQFIYGCEISSFITQTFNVNINQSVEVRAEYVSPYTSGTFDHCVGFQQNGNFSLKLHNRLWLFKGWQEVISNWSPYHILSYSIAIQVYKTVEKLIVRWSPMKPYSQLAMRVRWPCVCYGFASPGSRGWLQVQRNTYEQNK